MASEYEKYLVAHIFNEGTNITYRLLSHNFKIHASKAKQILHDFHRTENVKKSGSVHATYYVSGLRESQSSVPVQRRDADGDVAMPSSPGISSSMPPPAEDQPSIIKVLTLARENELEDVKARFSKVTSTHVYSIGPSNITDFEVLSTVAQQVNDQHADEDPLVYFKQYGVIQNPTVRRRTALQKGVAAVPVDAATAFPSKAKASSAPDTSTQSSTATTNSQLATKGGARKESRPATLKKEGSDILKSFAKAKPKQTPKPELTEELTEDVPMTGDSGSEDEGAESHTAETTATANKAREERENRQQHLRALMDEEDEPMEDPGDSADEIGSEEEPEPEPELEPAEKSALMEEEPEPEAEPATTVSNGRRRGKRKVMKKKTMKDEEGYLITKEELVWESFSEDEPTPPSSKPKSGSKPKSSNGKGQGSIMSFFGKK